MVSTAATKSTGGIITMKRVEIAALLMVQLSRDAYFGTNEKPDNPWPWIVKEALKGADELHRQIVEE